MFLKPNLNNFSKDGWVEHDANEIFDTVVGCIKDVMEKSKQPIKKS